MGTCRLVPVFSLHVRASFRTWRVLSLAALATAGPAWAAPKLDKETCAQLKAEQTTFMASGIVEDLQRGPAWGKANLSPERLREIEHFILLDEQLKFGCRQVTLTADVLRAGEAASRIENPQPAAPAEGGAARAKPAQDGERQGAQAQGAQSAVEDGASPPGTTGAEGAAVRGATTGLAGDAVDAKPAAKPQASKPKPPAAATAAPAKPKAGTDAQKPAALTDE